MRQLPLASKVSMHRTFIKVEVESFSLELDNLNWFHAQKLTLSLFIVGFGDEQRLDIALAIHTIEMIPKSMILICSMISTKLYTQTHAKLKTYRHSYNQLFYFILNKRVLYIVLYTYMYFIE